MDNPFKSPVVLSLCTGMRGLERGIERAIGPVRTIAFLEIEAFVVENLVQQMEQGVLAPTPIWSNLKTFDWESFHGKVHGITGGYPCQPFSVAGKQLGTEDPRHLWPYIKEGIRAVRPVWCFFENVPGHLNIGYREVRSDLEQLGYAVEEDIFSAEEVGAPHQRKRLFILAVGNSYRQHRRKQQQLQGSDREKTRNKLSGGGQEMDDTSSNGPESEHEISTGWDRPEYAGEERLANANNSGERTRSGETESKSEKIEGEEQREEWNEVQRERMRSESSNESSGDKLANTKHDGYASSEIGGSVEERGGVPSGKKDGEQSERCSQSGVGLADSCGKGHKGSKRGRSLSEQEKTSPESTSEYGEVNRWPARPNEQQYEWEAPRVESSVGYAINGYNFREDLLRMAGNGVVEQTAELAFRTLLKKHGIDSLKSTLHSK